MANSILTVYDAAAALGFGTSFADIDSLGNGNLARSDNVVNASPSKPAVRIFFQVKTGTSPTDGSPIRFFVARGDDHGTEIRSAALSSAHGTETSNQALIKSQLELVH